jgi:hypothetical protein
MKHLLNAAALGLTLFAGGAFAQSANPPAMPAVPAAPAAPVAPAAVIVSVPGQANILRAGTEVPLLMREELTTKKKKLRVGQRFQMEVGASVIANGVTVIPAGTPVVGEVTEVRNKGMWGKSGYIGARAVSLRLGDRNVRLTGSFDDKGVTGTGGVVAAIAFIPIAGFFTTGTSAVIPLGGAVKGFLDEDIAFQPTVPAQAPAQP